MVDFTRRLTAKAVTRPIDPEELYNSLDRASDKGPLRPAQTAVLREWHSNRRSERDVIIKLHTGQGKTIIGLVILQSRLNEEPGPTVYLCPNNYLIAQTCTQAEQFGIRICRSEDGELPQDFIDGRAIFVTSIHKMFNGLTKFGLGQRSLPVSNLLMDDSHACIDAIRDAFTVRLERNADAYQQIVQLFAQALEAQGAGSFADIKSGNPEVFLPVPYWEWTNNKSEITAILSKVANLDAVKFVWPLVKDSLEHCQCIVGGANLEIQPYLPGLDLFGSYFKAKHRVFMSATVTNDSFLVRGLRLSPDTIRNPIIYQNERWSGEKMILIPSLIHEDLKSPAITAQFGKPITKKFGIVVLTTSFKSAEKWKQAGARVATKDTIIDEIKRLREGQCGETLAIVNRYDGIDLPDAVCRVLILDGQPYADSLVDRYNEWCRSNSEIMAVRTARIIEQGIGRSVRGEKDYSVVLLLGSNLIKTIRNTATRRFFSNQTRQQVELGLEIAKMAVEDAEEGSKPMDTLIGLINQCLKRDDGWKAFYSQDMDAVVPNSPPGTILDVFQLELQAEEAFQRGDPQQAVQILQGLIDKHISDEADKRWYMQEMSRYTNALSESESNKLQIEAHHKNRFLLKPRMGMHVDRLIVVSQARVSRIIAWAKLSENHEQLRLAVEDILSRLEFGVIADKFEAAIHDLGRALGFACERPDKEWKEGPDNIWGVKDEEYIIIECKNEVLRDRTEINKSESGQMNNACAWFTRNYTGAKSKNVMIIPTNKLGLGAGFNEEVGIMSDSELKKLRRNVRAFFSEFAGQEPSGLSERRIQQWLNSHELSADSILTGYVRGVHAYQAAAV
jgi:replicative superfamily II helicase